MPTRKSALLLLAFASTCAFVGVFGSSHRAQTSYVECVGKAYGTPGCPMKQVSYSCGDGRVDAGEECDNGEGRNGDGNCSATCLFLACGDGVLSPDLGEECEPKREEVYAVDPATGRLTTELRFMAASCGVTCSVPDCGDDGVCVGGCENVSKPACAVAASSVPSSKASEPVHAAAASSSSDAYVARCGNATKDPGEQCDDGNALDSDGCTIACKLPRCGDGAVQKGEECDDGNDVNADSCTSACKRPSCGDGVVQQQEQCDAGGNNSDYLPNACRADCSAPRCGDAVVDNGEECDGGESCTKECTRVKSLAMLVMDTPGASKAAIALSVFGAILVVAFVFRRFVHRVVKHVAGENVARSIDDIPLDEIEMPWHAWGERDNK